MFTPTRRLGLPLSSRINSAFAPIHLIDPSGRRIRNSSSKSPGSSDANRSMIRSRSSSNTLKIQSAKSKLGRSGDSPYNVIASLEHHTFPDENLYSQLPT